MIILLYLNYTCNNIEYIRKNGEKTPQDEDINKVMKCKERLILVILVLEAMGSSRY